MPDAAAIEVRGLSKTYRSGPRRGGLRALAPLDLDVRRGEIFGLLGPNGAGKTTLVKLLLGVVRPTTGTASLFGVPAGRPEARASVGFLPENHRFPEFLTAEQTLDVYARMAGVPDDLRARRIPELLARVRMEEWRHMRVRKFSKGMMQRLGLAQALMNDPALVFLDEPTDGVDPIGRREIRDLLVELRAEGKTIFLNSHLLSEVEQLCTRVAILHRGELVRHATVDELTVEARLYEIRCTPLDPALAARLGALESPAPPVPEREAEPLAAYRLPAADLPALNRAIDALRGAGVLVESVRPVRRTLEETFIQVVTDPPPA